MTSVAVGDCIVVAGSDKDGSEAGSEVSRSDVKAEAKCSRTPTTCLSGPVSVREHGSSRQTAIEICDSDEEREPPLPGHLGSAHDISSTSASVTALSSTNERPSSQVTLNTPKGNTVPADPKTLQAQKRRSIKIIKPLSTSRLSVTNQGLPTKKPVDSVSSRKKRSIWSLSPTPEELPKKRHMNDGRKDPLTLSSPVSPPARCAQLNLTQKTVDAADNDAAIKCLPTTSKNKKTSTPSKSLRGNNPLSLSSNGKEPSTAHTDMDRDDLDALAGLKKEQDERGRLERQLLFASSQLESVQDGAATLRNQLIGLIETEMELFDILHPHKPLSSDEVDWFRQNIIKIKTAAKEADCTPSQLYDLIKPVQTRVNLNLSNTVGCFVQENKICESTMERLVTANGQLRERCHNIETQLSAKTAEVDSLLWEVADKDIKFAGLREDQEKSENESRKTEEKLRREMTELSTVKASEIAELNTRIQQLTNEATQLKEDIVNLAASSTNTKDAHTRLKVHLDDLRKDFVTVIGENEAMKCHIAGLDHDKGDLKEQVKVTQNQLNHIQEQKTKWTTEKQHGLHEVAGLQNLVAMLRQDRLELERDLEARRENIWQFERAQERWAAERMDLYKYKAELETRNGTQAALLEQLQREKSEWMANAAMLQVDQAAQQAQAQEVLALREAKQALETTLGDQARELDYFRAEYATNRSLMGNFAALVAKGATAFQRPGRPPSIPQSRDLAGDHPSSPLSSERPVPPSPTHLSPLAAAQGQTNSSAMPVTNQMGLSTPMSSRSSSASQVYIMNPQSQPQGHIWPGQGQQPQTMLPLPRPNAEGQQHTLSAPSVPSGRPGVASTAGTGPG